MLRNSGAWEQSVIDLTEYAGHSFVLSFNAYNSGAGRTWMFLDDVELLVCSRATPVPMAIKHQTIVAPLFADASLLNKRLPRLPARHRRQWS